MQPTCQSIKPIARLTAKELATVPVAGDIAAAMQINTPVQL